MTKEKRFHVLNLTTKELVSSNDPADMLIVTELWKQDNQDYVFVSKEYVSKVVSK